MKYKIVNRHLNTIFFQIMESDLEGFWKFNKKTGTIYIYKARRWILWFDGIARLDFLEDGTITFERLKQ